MEMRDYLELGAKKAGSLTALGKMLDLSQPFMSQVKTGKKPLPLDAAVKLADYIGADLRSVVAANELITEKKPEKRAYWLPFVKNVLAQVKRRLKQRQLFGPFQMLIKAILTPFTVRTAHP